ncbi:MAG TPA: serine hydrolase domain-containing protein [Polyangia bacterium]|jgi:CubicO group peptidase (beta-lactamase class C family)
MPARSSLLALSVASLLLAAGCGGARPSAPPASPPRAAAAPASRPVAAKPAAAAAAPAPVATCTGPCSIATAAGAILPVPERFVATRRGAVIELVEPDEVVRLALVEVERPSCASATAAAWAAAAPTESWRLHQAVSPPPSKGFDEIRVETYVPAPDRQVAQAIARRKGARVWVALVRGPAAALDKRAAQLNTFLSGLKAPGVADLDLSARPAKPIAGSRAALAEFIAAALRETETPGLAIAIVENGAVALAEGYGVRTAGRPEPVTPATLMMIGSVTKSLTTLMMATAVDDGKLAWSRRVRAVLPTFRLGDEKLAAALTVEQLVCACAGLPRKDLPLILSFAGKGHDDVLRELARMTPSTGLRETFQYQNHMVAAGGYVAAHALAPREPLGRAYDQAMAARVFRPLGMTATTLDLDAALKVKDHAMPHSLDLEGRHQLVPIDHERFASFIRPSGGVWSNVRDMARYVIMELGRGIAPGGRRIVSEANGTYRWQPQVKVNADSSYGLGWLTSRTKGLRVVTHGGGTMGFATTLAFFPEKGVGVVMIANGTGGHAAEAAILGRLMELWFDYDDRAAARLRHGAEEQQRSRAQLKARLSTPAAAWMKPLLGSHHNPEIGTITIAATAGGYTATLGKYRTGLLRHDRPDGNAALIFTTPPLAGLELLRLDGTAGTLEMVRAQERYVFQRGKK